MTKDDFQKVSIIKRYEKNSQVQRRFEIAKDAFQKVSNVLRDRKILLETIKQCDTFITYRRGLSEK